MKNIANWFVRVAVSYLVVGVGFGIFMAAGHDFTLRPLHVHINLLGWASMTLFALFYRQWPAAAQSRLARAHFGLYVPAHLLQMICLGLYLSGHAAIEPVLAIASMLVGVAVLIFAVNVWRHTDLA